MPIIKIRRGTTEQWSTSNKVLQVGELGIDVDLNKVKAGNGNSLWPVLPWLHTTPEEVTIQYAGMLSDANDYTDAAVTSLGNTVDGAYVPISDVGNPDGVASLDVNGKIPDSEIPDSIARDSEVSSAISTAISSLIDAAPGTLDTLNELAAAINDDSSFASTVTTALGTKEPLLPSQTGNSGKFLTTDGSSKSWQTVQEASPTIRGTVYGSTGYNYGLSLGYNALSSTTSGQLNIALGDLSLRFNTTGSSNIAIGPQTHYLNTTGSENVAVGVQSLYNNTTGSGNTALGMFSLLFNTTGEYNTALGYNTGRELLGSNNILVGNDAQASTTTTSNEITIGNSSITKFRIPGLSIDWDSNTVPAGKLVETNSQSTSYTLSTSDLAKLIEMSNGGVVTITDSASFPVGFAVDILQTGSSQVTIAGNGFTPNATPGLKLRTQWSSATLIKRALNSWVVLGDLSA